MSTSENRIVVDYKGRKELIFLGTVDRCTGEANFENTINWTDHTQKWDFYTQEQMVSWLNKQKGVEFEGFVVHYSDGSIFKMKGEDYMHMHKIVTQFTFKRVLEAYQEGKHEDIRKDLPEEMIPDFDEYRNKIQLKQYNDMHTVLAAFDSCPKTSRKDFALFLKANYANSIALRFAFTLLDFGNEVTKEGVVALLERLLKSYKALDFDIEEKTQED